MDNRLLLLAIRLYRANPLRPHCDGATGSHVWLCRVTGMDEFNCKKYQGVIAVKNAAAAEAAQSC